MMSATVGERIRVAREKAKMSQADVAKHLGLTRTAVAQWEADTTGPSLRKVIDVAKILGVSPEWLAFGVEVRSAARRAEPGLVDIREVMFGDAPDVQSEIAVWTIPRIYLQGELRASATDTLILWRVEGSHMAPAYAPGDMLFVDTSMRRPSPGGVFLHWDGVGPILNQITVRPLDGRPTALVSYLDGNTPSYDIEPDALRIVGRARGILKAI